VRFEFGNVTLVELRNTNFLILEIFSIDNWLKECQIT